MYTFTRRHAQFNVLIPDYEPLFKVNDVADSHGGLLVFFGILLSRGSTHRLYHVRFAHLSGVLRGTITPVSLQSHKAIVKWHDFWSGLQVCQM